MDFDRKEQHIAILSLVGVFLLVTAFWILIRPGFSKYLMHRSETKLKEKLKAIKPPAGGTSGDIQITRVPKFGYISATRLDMTNLDCMSGETYYRNEFTNAGFRYDGEKVDPKQHTKTLSFSGQTYDASVLCWDLQSDLRKAGVQSDVRNYIVNMWGIEP
ncbi:MAG TPA: hypothetical protein VJW20_12855 [Candidatus Angelobacter sp.]|nr:hypothetical protein [Candidatus Angelobacter sp.]